MATWDCGRCSTVYSVGAPSCPHCGAPASIGRETGTTEGDDMPKTTAAGGSTDATEGVPEGTRSADEREPAQPAIGAPAEDSMAEPVELPEVPGGTIAEVLDWVNDDPGDEDPPRVDRALTAEGQRATPRTSLVATLEQIRRDGQAQNAADAPPEV